MFEFLDDSDETVKTRFRDAVAADPQQVELAADVLLRSAIVATAVFLLLLAFATT